jgi:transposase
VQGNLHAPFGKRTTEKDLHHRHLAGALLHSGSGSGKRASRNAGHRAPARLHNAIRDELPDAVPVLDAFHVVRLGTQVVDEVRRRVQQDTLGHRGHKNDPLYQIRGLLRHGVEHLSERQQAKLSHGLEAGDPDGEVDLAWQCYQQLRSIYHAAAAQGRRIAEKVIASFPTCPIPEIARLGRTLKAWRQQVLAYFDTHGVSNGGTEAINLIIEKVRRLAHGFKEFDHYRLRILLAASGHRPYRT